MKRTSIVCILALALGFVSGGALGQGAAPEQPPEAKDAAAQAAAKKKAEDERYDGISKKHRDAVRFLEKDNPKLMEAWFAIRDVIRTQVELDQVWGTGDRKKAERRRVELEAKLPALKKTFKEQRARYEPGIHRQLDKARRKADKLADQAASRNEQQQAMDNEALATLRAEIARYEAVLSALRSIGSFSASRYRYSVDDRLATLGISRNDYAIRKNMEDYEKILNAVFTVRDHIAEVEELEALKAAGEEWTRRHEFTLTRATAAMETAGRKLEKWAIREQAPTLRRIAKLKSKINELDARIEKLPQGSPSQERLFKEKWELELELVPHEIRIETLKKLGDWKRLRNVGRAPEPAQ